MTNQLTVDTQTRACTPWPSSGKFLKIKKSHIFYLNHESMHDFIDLNNYFVLPRNRTNELYKTYKKNKSDRSLAKLRENNVCEDY